MLHFLFDNKTALRPVLRTRKSRGYRLELDFKQFFAQTTGVFKRLVCSELKQMKSRSFSDNEMLVVEEKCLMHRYDDLYIIKRKTIII